MSGLEDVFEQRLPVLRRRIATMSIETIRGEFAMQLIHHPVTRNLGNYRCCTYCGTDVVTAHQRGDTDEIVDELMEVLKYRR